MWWRKGIGLLIIALAVALIAPLLTTLGPSKKIAQPLSVPEGDCEIAWLHNPTAFESWEQFVWGVKRAEMPGNTALDGLSVDDSGAYPDKTTQVPEVVIRRSGYAGAVRIRWYKVTDETTQEAWVRLLAMRDPKPIAVLGGWSSDRAKALADAMRETNWGGSRPLLFFTRATADTVHADDNIASGGQGPSLISVYDRSYRFCFTNRQMAKSITNFVLTDPTLKPGRTAWTGLHSIGSSAAGVWAGLISLGADFSNLPEPIPGYAIEWKDDPYSTDLSYKFREALREIADQELGCTQLEVTAYSVPFSVGRFHQPNPAEVGVAEHILANLPPPGMRTMLVIPTVSAPARRTMRWLVQGNPAIGRQLVALTGDGISVNTFFRDREFAWPVRSLPVPMVLFTHADPLGWDQLGVGHKPPPDYELTQPAPGEVRSSTEDIRLFTRVTRVLAQALFPNGSNHVVTNADEFVKRLQDERPAFFDTAGDRLDDTGEHVVVLRPIFPGEERTELSKADATLEVYTRTDHSTGWTLVHSRSLGRDSASTGGDD